MDLQLIFLSFVAGIVSVTSPCVFPLIPIVMAGSTGSKLRPIFIVLGIAISFTLMGVIISQVGGMAGAKISSSLRVVGIALIIIMGFFLVSDKLNNYFVMYSSVLLNKLKLATSAGMGEGWSGALILGTSLGVVWIPCVGPVLGTVLTAVALKGQVLVGGLSLFLYSIGIGIPMLAVAYLGKYATSRMEGISKYNKSIKKVAGIIIIIMGIAFYFGIELRIEGLLAPYFPEFGLGL
ncbi:thiol:disulfide interchange protein DsbD precursor [archaeon]|nr:thiol:disulfide interchange protein DsbD precursor [archaeon]